MAKQSMVTYLKLEAGCHDCGDRWQLVAGEDPDFLDFDHVRGKKLFGVAIGYSRNLYVLLDEIEKCDVVCAFHHRQRTYRRLREKGRSVHVQGNLASSHA